MPSLLPLGTAATGLANNSFTMMLPTGGVAATVGVSHIAALLGAVSHVHAVKEGYRRPHRLVGPAARWITLETMLLLGAALALAGVGVLMAIVLDWSSRNFGSCAVPNIASSRTSTGGLISGQYNATIGAQTNNYTIDAVGYGGTPNAVAIVEAGYTVTQIFSTTGSLSKFVNLGGP